MPGGRDGPPPSRTSNAGRAPGGPEGPGHGLTGAQLATMRWRWLRQLWAPPGRRSLLRALIAAAGGSITERILAAGREMLAVVRPGDGMTIREVLRRGGLDPGIIRMFLAEQAAADPQATEEAGTGQLGLGPVARYLGLGLVMLEDDGALAVPEGAPEPGDPGEHRWVFVLGRDTDDGTDYMGAQ